MCNQMPSIIAKKKPGQRKYLKAREKRKRTLLCVPQIFVGGTSWKLMVFPSANQRNSIILLFMSTKKSSITKDGAIYNVS